MLSGARKKYGEYLLENGKVTEEQIKLACDYQQTHKELKIGEIFYKLGILSKETVINTLAAYLDKKAVKLDNLDMPRELKDIFSMEFMQSNCFAPFQREGKVLKIAIDDINNFELKSDIDLIVSRRNYTTEYYLSLSETIKEFIRNSALRQDIIEKNIPELVDTIINDGIHYYCSDIHIEPISRNKVRIRYRIDGHLILSKIYVPVSAYEEVISRIKILAGLNTTEKRRAQDGHIPDFTSKSGKVFDIRVSVVLVAHGEKIVLRLLNKDEEIKNLEELGFNTYQSSLISDSIKRKNGIIFVTGATGTGKSTTLYTLLNSLNKTNVNIITIEDPIERTIEGINQININEAIGVSFSNTLRTVLRQDPDVIMVGEVRDKKTLSMVLEASMTGHLVLTTLHTNSATQTIDRINTMGIDMYNFASSLVLVVSQVLIRKLCPKCKAEFTPSAEEHAFIKRVLGNEINENISIYKSVGCSSCNGGYKGREVVCELFTKDAEISKLILSKVSSIEIEKYLARKGFTTILHQAVKKVLDGTTSLEEVYGLNAE